MLWNWLTEVLRSKSKARGRDGHASPKRRPRLLELELLETRVMPIVQGIPGAPLPAVAPGGPFDGVVEISRQIPGVGTATGSGSLLYDNNHILTAAHVVAGGTLAQKVTFNLIRQNDPGVGMGVAVPVNITLTVPANGGSNQFQKTALGYVPKGGLPGPDLINDLGILTLPDQTPVPGQPAGRLVAPYYGLNSGFQLYSGNAPLVGQNVTLVGYGDTGAGATGETNDEVQQISITNPTAATTFTLSFNGGPSTLLSPASEKPYEATGRAYNEP